MLDNGWKMRTMRNRNLFFRSTKETQLFGTTFAQSLKKGAIVACFGEMGSGKTTFLKSVIASITQCPQDLVDSPTFNYMNIYEGSLVTCYHFDLYRLKNSSDFLALGFEEFFYKEGICLIEWSEKIEHLLPSTSYKLFFSHTPDHHRQCLIEGPL